MCATLPLPDRVLDLVEVELVISTSPRDETVAANRALIPASVW